jgi:molybdopterin guanine dinucleotide-containing S/N-oxide reductase-like protein
MMNGRSEMEKTVIKTLSLGSTQTGGCPCAVDVSDNKIIRIRPLHYDWKYKREDFNPWKFQRNGKVLEPLMKSLPAPFSLAYKKRVYSPNRILYPLKRIDWDPNGERHPENRGKSKFKRISWEEISRLIADEIKRIHKTYGPLGIFAQADGHGECKTVHAAHGQQTLLLEKMGGYTQQLRNPDSWEGWYWGAKHVWGQGAIGMMSPNDNLVKDITENADTVLFWGCDPETTPWGFTGQFASRLCYFWSEAGIKQIYICPDVNYGCAVHADKWIPILPNTDAALQLAIIYMWIKEDTYDKEYVKTHTVGFDKVADYVMGKVDGMVKDPQWASKKCGVPVWTIKALARDWAKKIVSIAHYFGGGLIRGPFSHEPARLECVLLGMQGLGKPGVHQCQLTYQGMPRNQILRKGQLHDADFSVRVLKPPKVSILPDSKQHIPKVLLYEAITNPPITYWGSGGIDVQVEDQFKKYTYPIPESEGGTEIHMIWSDSPCLSTCWNCGNAIMDALKSPKIETIVVQHPWMENDTVYADLILPVCTTLEIEDIVTNLREGTQFQSIVLQKQAIKPAGESKSDYEVVLEVAKELGKYTDVTEGKTFEELMLSYYNLLGVQKLMDWQEFKRKDYFVFPFAVDWENDSPGLRKFYEDPQKNPLKTPSGKLEFYSDRLAKHFPNDTDRPPYPHWVEKSQMHDERISGERSKMFPLLVVSNHAHWRVHAECDDISWTREAPTCKVKGPDGYLYEPVWIHPKDAEVRGIKDGDIVKVFNERGIVLFGALVWERIMPGVISIDHGARCDAIIPGKIDRGGAINLISPQLKLSTNCVGLATSGFLVDVQKVTTAQIDEWMQERPVDFNKGYDPASGLRFDDWVE